MAIGIERVAQRLLFAYTAIITVVGVIMGTIVFLVMMGCSFAAELNKSSILRLHVRSIQHIVLLFGI